MSKLAMQNTFGNTKGIKPDKHDKLGPLVLESKVMQHYLGLIMAGRFFKIVGDNMTSDTNDAVTAVERVSDRFTAAINNMDKTTEALVSSAQKSSSKVRDAAEKLSVGMQRVEKAANFDRLERYVELLERAASAMAVLAELDNSGKLEKIAAAIR